MKSKFSSSRMPDGLETRPVSPRSIWWDFVSTRWPLYTIGILTVAFTNIMQVTSPRLLGILIDFFKGNPIPAIFVRPDRMESYHLIVSCMILALLLLAVARFGWRISLARSTHTGGAWLRKNIWTEASSLPQKVLNSQYNAGQLMSISTSDVGAAKQMLGFALVGTVDVIFLGTMTIISMFLINVKMTLITLVLLPLLPRLIQKIANWEELIFTQAQEHLAQFNEQALQAVSTIRLQRLTQTASFWERRLLKSADAYRLKRREASLVSLLFTPLMGTSALITYAILFSIGIYQIFNHQMSIGEFVAFESYIFLIQDPLALLGFVISDIQYSKASFKRIADLANQPKETIFLTAQTAPHTPLTPNPQSAVYDIRQLTFQFEGSNRVLFSGLNLQLRPGQRLGIMGPIGSGKSVLMNILAGLEQNYQGDVQLYGHDLRSYPRMQLCQEIGMVFQKPFLFADTIRNNLCLDLNLSDDEVWHYLKLAGLESDVRQFPHTIHTGLGEWGINLSGGQKQRLTLARALARRPRILLLDDCLSAIDIHTEIEIIKGLDQEFSRTKSTIIWVAHRPHTLQYCDTIWDLGQEGPRQ